MVAGFDKIVTGTANCLSSRRCFPTTLLFMHFSPHAPWKSVYVERNRTAFRNFKESLNCLVLLRSFKRGARARAATSTPPKRVSAPRWNRWNRNQSNILIAIHRSGWNVLLDNRWIAQRTNSAVETLISHATRCNRVNEAGPRCEKQNLDLGVNKPGWKWHFARINRTIGTEKSFFFTERIYLSDKFRLLVIFPSCRSWNSRVDCSKFFFIASG